MLKRNSAISARTGGGKKEAKESGDAAPDDGEQAPEPGRIFGV